MSIPTRSKWFDAGVCLLVVTLLVALAPSAHAQTDAEVKCRAAMAKGMGNFVKALQKAVVKCHKGRNKGTVPEGTDCSDPSTADSVANKDKAFDKASYKAFLAFTSSDCSAAPAVLTEFGRCPVPFETLDDFGATTGIDDANELFDCLSAHAVDLVETAARATLGTPTLPLDKDQQKCHAAIAKAYTKLVDTTVKERSKCQTSADKDGGGLGFVCATADPKNKIAKARDKGKALIASKCAPVAGNAFVVGRAGFPRAVPELGSCSADVSQLPDCVMDEAGAAAAGGTAAMLWELPGICPGNGSYQVTPVATGTELDAGFNGVVHDMDPILGYRGVTFTITCDPDCASCSSTSIGPSPDACRCNGDASVHCSTDPDCTGFGGTCECYYGPPTPYAAAGTPACVQSRIVAPPTGSLDPATGDISFALPTSHKIYLGIGFTQPCPQCFGGVCVGGARDTLPCTVDGSDATFGDVSYDCPPSFASNVSGLGLFTKIDYTTGTASLPFAVACDPPLGAFSCACSTCSLDNTIACVDDSDCTVASAGVCRTDGGHGGAFRLPNACDDGTCSPDPGAGPHEGTCLAGPVDSFCDGWLRSNGDGILYCASNGDCDVFDPACPGGDCGNCSLSKNRDCFLDPIVADGVPGETIVGEGCLGVTGSAAVNSAISLPGAYRVRQNLSAELLCSDGVTPYYPPGGSNCP